MLSIQGIPHWKLSALAAVVAVLAILPGARASTRAWNQNAAGNWSYPGNWSPAGIPEQFQDAVVPLALGSSYLLLDVDTQQLHSFSLNSPTGVLDMAGHQLVALDTCTIAGTLLASGTAQRIFSNLSTSAGSSVSIFDGATLTLSGPSGGTNNWTNDGHVVVHATEGTRGGALNFNGGAYISGGGDIQLADPSHAAVTGDPMTQYASHVLHGTGTVSVALTNHGMVSADISGQVLALTGPLSNDGTLQAVHGGVLTLQGSSLGNAGTLYANGGEVRLIGETITGGQIATSGASQVSVPSALAWLSELGNSGAIGVYPGATLRLSNTLTNNGHVVLHSGGGASVSVLDIYGGTTLAGAGDLWLNDPDRAVVSGDMLTHAAGHTLHGTGVITAPLTNHGLMSADSSGEALTVSGPVSNDGTLQATRGGVLLLQDNSLGGPGLVSASGGEVRLVNETLGGGRIRSLSGGLVTVPSGQSWFWGIHNAANVQVAGGAMLRFRDAVTDSGHVLVHSDGAALVTSLNMYGYVYLGGSGDVQLNDPAYAQVNGDGFIQYAGHSLHGTGVVFSSMTNQGVLGADVSGSALTVVNPGNLSGLQFASRGGTLAFSNNPANYAAGVLSGGTWEAFAGSRIQFPSADILELAATAVLDGAGADLARADVAQSALRDLSTVDAGGTFVVRNGRLFGSHAGLDNFGIVGVGPGSALSVGFDQAGGYHMDSGATFLVEIGGRSPGGWGRLVVNGAATVAGHLRVRVLNGFQPVATDTFEVLDFVSRSGDFASLDSLQVTSAVKLVPVWQADRLLLVGRLTTTAVPGSQGGPAALALLARGGIGGPARIELALPRAASVEVTLHDVTGRRVATLARGRYTAGSWTWNWGIARDGARSGAYFARARVTTEGRTRELAAHFILCR